METYILLTKLTDHGRKTLKEKPQRTQEVNKEVEKMGGNRTIAKISVELGSRGTMEIMTLPVVTLQ